MTPSTLAALKALAEGATPGPRLYVRGVAFKHYVQAGVFVRDGVEYPELQLTLQEMHPIDGHETRAEADARYIAAASPSAVLALVAEVERMREALEDEYMGYASAPEDTTTLACIGCIRQDAKSAQRAATWEAIQHLPGCALRGEP